MTRLNRFSPKFAGFPFIYIALFFISGIITARGYEISLLVYCISIITASAGLFFVKKHTALFVLIIFLVSHILGASYYAVHKKHRLHNSRIITNLASHNPIWIVGSVVRPHDYFSDKAFQSFVLRSEAVTGSQTVWKQLDARILIHKWGNVERFKYGDRMLINGSIKKNGVVYAKKSHAVTLLAKKPILFPLILIHRVRDHLLELIQLHLNPISRHIIGSMLIGERRSLPDEIKQLFITTGTMHLLAISGLHTGIIAMIIMAVLSAVRLRRRLMLSLTCIMLVLYAFLTGFNVPVVRSVIMAEIFLIGLILNREVNVFNSLSIAALILLASSPYQLFNIGFQLSFTAVFWICLLTPLLTKLLYDPQRSTRFPHLKRWYYTIILLISGSAAAWIGTMPLIIYYFGVFVPIGLIANIIFIPLMSCILTAGICFILCAGIIPPLAGICAASVEGLVWIFLKLLDMFSSMSWGYTERVHMPAWWVLLFYTSLLLCTYMYRTQRKPT